jgi:hypothetical protein
MESLSNVEVDVCTMQACNYRLIGGKLARPVPNDFRERRFLRTPGACCRASFQIHLSAGHVLCAKALSNSTGGDINHVLSFDQTHLLGRVEHVDLPTLLQGTFSPRNF